MLFDDLHITSGLHFVASIALQVDIPYIECARIHLAVEAVSARPPSAIDGLMEMKQTTTSNTMSSTILVRISVSDVLLNDREQFPFELTDKRSFVLRHLAIKGSNGVFNLLLSFDILFPLRPF